MPRLPKLFGRKQADAHHSPIDGPSPPDAPVIEAAPDGPALDAPPDDHAAEPPLSHDEPSGSGAPDGESVQSLGAAGDEDTSDEAAPAGPSPEPAPLSAPQVDDPPLAPALEAERRGAESKTLIGGKEADLVPVIPDTEVDLPDETDLDEESMAAATVEALQGACRVMVDRVNALRRAQDGTQIVAGLIALVGELDVRYARDWGIVRRNGLEEVLVDVRESVVEGDRFILESLENGRGGLTADRFLRDLRTIAPSDRPRMVAAYAMFLIFVLKCVLRQYLRPLEQDQDRMRDVARRLEYLIDGIRDSLLGRINGMPRLG